MTITEFIQSTDFTSTEKLIITYMLYLDSIEFSLSLKEAQPLFGISYVTAQKSLKNLTDKRVLFSYLKRDNSATRYAILLE